MRRYWPVAVVGLIGVALSANFALVYLALSDPDFSVEPDYYAKALRWDERRAQEGQNVRLGWTLDLTVAPERSADGSRLLEVRLRDAASVPIADASLSLTAFHNARSSEVQHAVMGPRADGTYRGSLRFYRPGLWEFRFEARRGQQVFTKTVLEDVWPEAARPARKRQ